MGNLKRLTETDFFFFFKVIVSHKLNLHVNAANRSETQLKYIPNIFFSKIEFHSLFHHLNDSIYVIEYSFE